MPRQSNHSLFGWTAAVTVPLVVLAILAAFGIRSQKIAAKTRVQEEAVAISGSQARLLSQQLPAAIQEFPQFPNPPVPGRKSHLDDILAGNSLPDLKKLRDNPGAGNSPAGLPRRVLAALRIEQLFPGKQESKVLVGILTNEVPSVLTLPALKRLRDRDSTIGFPEVWQLMENLDELKVAYPNGGWIDYRGKSWWMSPDGKRFLTPSALDTEEFDIPNFVSVRFSSNTRPLAGSEDGELLASSKIDFPSPLALEWVLTDPDAIEASTRQQTRWTLALLGASLLVSICGLWAILRSVRQQQRLNHLKGQFVASVSHELRAPLSTIRLMAEALEAGRVESPREFHRMIGRESERLSHLVENVLDLARIEEGRRDYRFENSDLAVLVEDMVDLFTPRAADSGHTLQVSVEAGMAKVDDEAVQQAIANLLDNALKFSPPSSEILIALTWSASSWSIAITDQGPGVPEAERERIFERFHRLGDELRRETKGTGIGLSLVKHIIEAHGGTVTVTNDPTCFTLSAPIQPSESS